jgi:hypothetical protein
VLAEPHHVLPADIPYIASFTTNQATAQLHVPQMGGSDECTYALLTADSELKRLRYNVEILLEIVFLHKSNNALVNVDGLIEEILILDDDLE